MGQYFVIANLDKKEFIHPHRLGEGAKLWEIALNSTSAVFAFLLRQSSYSDGYCAEAGCTQAGRWAGDRIVVVGDYDKSGLYGDVEKTGDWQEISHLIIEELNQFIGVEEYQLQLR